MGVPAKVEVVNIGTPMLVSPRQGPRKDEAAKVDEPWLGLGGGSAGLEVKERKVTQEMFTFVMEGEELNSQRNFLNFGNAFLLLVQVRFLVLGKLYFVFSNSVHGISAMDTFLQALQRRFW